MDALPGKRDSISSFIVKLCMELCKRRVGSIAGSAKKVFVFFEKTLDFYVRLCYTISRVKKDAVALVAQLDRVTGYEPVGQGFESLTARQKHLYFAGAFLFSLSFFDFYLVKALP